MNIGDRNAGIVLGVYSAPKWRRANLIRSVFGVFVQVLIAAPSDALVGHGVVDCASFIGTIEQLRGVEGVVEHGIGNQSARVVGLVRVGVELQRVAVAAIDGRVVAKVAHKLVGVERLDITAVVLVEVCELVVEEDRRGEIVGDPEAQLADLGLDIEEAIVVGDGLVDRPPLRTLCRGGGILEVTGHQVARNVGPTVGSIACAVLIFNRQLLYLSAGPEQ